MKLAEVRKGGRERGKKVEREERMTIWKHGGREEGTEGGKDG